MYSHRMHVKHAYLKQHYRDASVLYAGLYGYGHDVFWLPTRHSGGDATEREATQWQEEAAKSEISTSVIEILKLGKWNSYAKAAVQVMMSNMCRFASVPNTMRNMSRNATNGRRALKPAE